MGAEIAAQSAFNSRLHRFTHSPYSASLISFIIGTLFLLGICLITRQPMHFSLGLVQHNPWWIWLGGFTSAFALTTNVLLFRHLGSVQTSVLPIMGQIIMSLIIDQFGLFNSQKSELTVIKIIGAVILIGGTIAGTGAFEGVHQQSNKSDETGTKLGWQLLGVIAGACLAIQAAVNGYLGQVLNSALFGTTIAFFISFGVLAMLCLVIRVPIRTGLARAVHHTSGNWFMWLGGFLGSSYVAISAQLVPIMGTGRVIMIALFGQLLFSALIDQFSWFRSVHRSVGRMQIIGLVAMLVGIFIINFVR